MSITRQVCRNHSAELCLAVWAIATVKSRNRGYRQGGSFNRMTAACLLNRCADTLHLKRQQEQDE